MNLLNILTQFYGKLHNYKGIPFWVLTPLRKATRSIANTFLPKYLAKSHAPNGIVEKDLIVSFTSFPARINNVWQVVRSLKNQSVLPEKIVLWLIKDEFPSKENIPQSLWNEEDELFEICIVGHGLRSHSKYYHAMQEFTDKTIVTCDDDIYYHPDTLLWLVQTSKRFPGCITANLTTQLTYSDTGELRPYLQWNHEYKPYSSKNNVQLGYGGVLYPPHSLSPLVFRKDLITRLAPLADDLWLSLMARLNKTPVVQTGYNVLCLPVESGEQNLCSVNNGKENMNDRQLAQMREWLHSEGLEDVFDSYYQVNSKIEGIK